VTLAAGSSSAFKALALQSDSASGIVAAGALTVSALDGITLNGHFTGTSGSNAIVLNADSDSSGETAGTYTGGASGGSYTGADFSSTNDHLIVTVGGGTAQTLVLTADLSSADVDTAASHINSLLSGATAAASGGHIQITSATTGTGSSIAVSAGATAGTYTGGASGGSYTGADFSSTNDQLVVTVDGGSAKTLSLTDNLSSADVATAASHINSLLSSESAGATAAASGTQIQITSGNSGSSSSIAVSAGATAGIYTGAAFTAFNFSGANEVLKVVVDGTPHTLTLTANCDTVANAVTHIESQLSSLSPGASAAVSGSYIRITSDSTGTGSSIAITSSDSGSNALALFGSGEARSGTDGSNALALFGSSAGTALDGTDGSAALALFGSSAGTAVQGTTGGQLTIASTKTLTSTDNTVLITAYDVDFDGGIDSGTAAITIHGSMADQTIGLGAEPLNMQLDVGLHDSAWHGR
jgi:hypothetical protein